MVQMENSEYGQEDLDPRQRPPPSKYVARPRVDAEATGEVDTNL